MSLSRDNCYGTPVWVIKLVERVFDCTIVLDVCAEDWSACARRYYTIEDDTFAQDWRQGIREGCDLILDSLNLCGTAEIHNPAAWMNCPFGNKLSPPFFDKATLEAAREGVRVIGVLQGDFSRRWLAKILEQASTVRPLVGKRVSYRDPHPPHESTGTGYGHATLFMEFNGEQRPDGPVWLPITPDIWRPVHERYSS